MTETHNGLTDLHSLIATIAQTAVDRDKLQHAISSLQASEVYDVNFSVVTNQFASTNFFVQLGGECHDSCMLNAWLQRACLMFESMLLFYQSCPLPIMIIV